MKAADRDLRAMRRLIVEGAQHGCEPELLLPSAMLEGLRSLLGCDAVSVGVIDSTQRSARPWQDLPVETGDGDPDLLAVFFQHYWDCVPCAYPDRSGDLDSVVKISDFYSARQYRDTGMWSEYFAPAGIAHHMTVCLAGAPGRTLRLAAFRDTGRDFTDRDRTILWLLRPHLYQMYRQRQAARSGAATLTQRQRELLRLVAAGHTDRQIARRLGIAESTVRKHLQNVFERLQVANRAAAAAAVREVSAYELPRE
ncbi:MAG: helix-turn-helix transcriptional regulator [Hamadaea sp.]|uniref:helix-turn-helix transcriptional regulator n=1 Tax=Hamadaea sp. TaxID=2024425 RepID=UPI00183BE866|nr:helix-turn-helix transcriptional regulator [Hamadaea sp.]NUR72823.1 helix-turn-helix transcriptional regulator [Hamadaea sp.]NUT20462.1 helix-turn-helix transcriptional regulator [Hamadaea sp.]